MQVPPCCRDVQAQSLAQSSDSRTGGDVWLPISTGNWAPLHTEAQELAGWYIRQHTRRVRMDSQERKRNLEAQVLLVKSSCRERPAWVRLLLRGGAPIGCAGASWRRWCYRSSTSRCTRRLLGCSRRVSPLTRGWPRACSTRPLQVRNCTYNATAWGWRTRAPFHCVGVVPVWLVP